MSAAVNCRFDAASGVNFGNYDVLSVVPKTSNGTLTFVCTGLGLSTQLVTVFLSTGNAPTFRPRLMRNGAQHLNYDLYLDAGLTLIWGDGSRGTFFDTVVMSENKPVTATIFGRIPAGQDVTPGSYADTITATINF